MTRIRFSLVLFLGAIGVSAGWTDMPYGPTVVPVILEPGTLDERDWGPGDKIWVEIAYLSAPDARPVSIEPAERLWFVDVFTLVLLGATSGSVPAQILDRGMG